MFNLKRASTKPKRHWKFTMPTTFTLLFFIITIIVVLSWILHASKVGYTETNLSATINFKDLTNPDQHTTKDLIEYLLNSWLPGHVTSKGDLNNAHVFIDQISWGDNSATVAFHAKYADGTSIGIHQQVSALGVLDILVLPLNGFVSSATIIIFIVVLGGFLAIVDQSGALEASIGHVVRKLKNKVILIIPIIMIIFSIFGTVYGFAEGTLAFYGILGPLLLVAGYDTITTFFVIMIGSGVGVMGAILDPFAVTVAMTATNDAVGDSASSLALTDGIAWRIIAWVILTASAIAFTTYYAYRVKQEPKRSPVFALKEEHRRFFELHKESKVPQLTTKRKIILVVFALTFVFMIVSLIAWGELGATGVDWFGQFINDKVPYLTKLLPSLGQWSLVEVSFIFLLATIIIGAINWKGEKHFVNHYLRGVGEFIGVGLVIAVSRGISLAFNDTGIQYAWIQSMESAINSLSPYLFMIIIFIIFCLISIIISSTSGFSYAVFPIVGPLAVDKGLGSGTILAFVLANGLMNLVTPVSPIVMGGLGLIKTPYQKMLKAIWPYLLFLFGISIVILVAGVAAGPSLF